MMRFGRSAAGLSGVHPDADFIAALLFILGLIKRGASELMQV